MVVNKLKSEKGVNKMRVLLAGIGGHGGRPLSMLYTSGHQIDILSLSVDSGGYTGEFCNNMEFDESRLNYVLHDKVISNYAWGDYNKLIAYFVGQSYPKCQKKFIAKTTTMAELLSNFNRFSNCIKLSSITSNEFVDYVRSLFGFCKTHNLKTDGASVAHIFNAYVFSRTNTMLGFNQFYHDLSLYPSNVNLHFLTEDRLVLKGVNCNGKVLIGEHVLDTHKHPINPPSLTLCNPNGSKVNKAQLKNSLELFTQADLVIIPNGSIANHLPLFNLHSIRECLRIKSEERKLLIMMNLFFKENEHRFSTYVEYYNSLKVHGIILGPKIRTHMLDEEMLTEYEKQGKRRNDLYMKANAYFASFDTISELNDSSVEGLKYTPESVMDTLKIFLR
jgi:predicted metallopeptidase